MRSGVIAAALMTTKGPVGAAGQLVERARRQFLAGARGADDENAAIGRRHPLDGLAQLACDGGFSHQRGGIGVSCLSSLTSRLSREVSSARSATSTSRSALNGFSMKS
jgi:hypothetical protein